jgi:hypothetical protein
MPSLSNDTQDSNNTHEQLVTIQCDSFMKNENRNHLSVPQQPTKISVKPNSKLYDSHGKEGRFFDAALHEFDHCSSNEEAYELRQSSIII